MAKKPRPPRLEKSCPLPLTHTRLHQVHEQWHRVATDYKDPDDFVTSLNSALTTLRSVSFMLKKESSRIPDFASWYEPHEQRYRTDPLMRWLKDARNHVEKEGDLELHSQARVTVLGGPGDPRETDLSIDPMLTRREIAERLMHWFPQAATRDGLVAVERRWVAASLPEYELLDVLAHGYGVIAEVVADAHSQCGVLMQTFGDEAHEDLPQRRAQLGGRLSCMTAHARQRTAYIDLTRRTVVEFGSRITAYRPPEHEGVNPLPGTPDAASPQIYGHMLDLAERHAESAKALTAETGEHGTMAFVYETRHDAPIMFVFEAHGRSEQTLAMESVAHEVARLRAEGVVFIHQVRKELLVAALTDDGRRRQWRTPLTRDASGKLSVGETVREDDVVPDFLNGIRRVWNRHW